MPTTQGNSDNRKILVIDDEEIVRKTMCSLLEFNNWQVFEAADGLSGVQILKDHGDEIELTFLDLTMPNVDGEKTLQEILKIRPQAKVVLMSGYSEEEIAQRFVGQPLAGFLQKPFTLSMLVNLLKAHAS